MKPNYSISFEFAGKFDLMGQITKEVMPIMHQTVRAVAKKTAENWQDAVKGQSGIWSVEKNEYIDSITWNETGDFSAVVSSDYKYVQDIETGRPARDLKRMLNTSTKVRRTESGKRFLVIPFRHNTPGNDALATAMPSGVYGLAAAMTPSVINNTGKREVGQTVKLSPHAGMTPVHGSPFLSNISDKKAATTEARLYSWGNRLTKGAMKGAGMDAATRKRYAGMVKMDTSTPGGPKSSAYLTFRIMMEGSKGWVVPAQPGRHIAQKVVQDMQPKAQQAFEASAKAITKAS
ncbi:hypothetical protein [Tardiphaga sp. 862_B3_N1_1]|uniref:hypothetical protein n=1 Tax=Tardiphaga sp. 862_B3_N1_1 TaxID=3240763 RepID=UPI003F8B9B60